jgi:gliding motility-associated-like protein
MTIIVYQVPTIANAGNDTTICSSSHNFNGNTPVNGTGIWSLVSGTGTPTSPNSPTSAVTGLSVGANIFQWTIANGPCAVSRDTMVINVDPMPTTSNAGPDQVICDSTAFLQGNMPLIGSGFWTRVGGTGNVVSPTQYNSTVTGLFVISNLFEWAISNGTCPTSRDTLVIAVNQYSTQANAGLDQVLCNDSATLIGNFPVIGSATWTLVAGTGNIISPTADTSLVTGLSVGQNIFEWSIVNSPCPVSRDTIIIQVDDFPTGANAGSDQTVCSTTSVFSGNTPIIGNGMWTLVSGTGTPINPTSPTSAVTGLTVGVNIFQWTITNGTCPSSSDQVKITVDPFPSTANAGADQTICISNVNVTMAANSPTIGSGAWALVTGQGTITNTTLENTTVTNLGGGANIFTWTITNGTCTPSVDTVIIFVDSLPSNSNAGTDQTICNSSSAFVGNAPTIGTGMWTLFSGTGTPTNPISPTSAVTGLSVGANIFVWAIVNGTCAASTDTVIINVDALPTTANAGADQFLCISTNNTLMTANNPSTGTGIWAIVSGSGNFANTTSPTSAINNVAFGTNIFTWTISNGTCPPSVDTMLIIVDSVPTAANAGANQTLCENNPTTSLNANTPTLGVGLWTLISGSGIITNPTSATTTVTNLATGTNVFQWAISLGNCSASVSTVTILVENLPTTADAGPDQNINTPMTQLSANIPVFGIGSWQLVSGTATIVNSNLDNTLITDLEVGTVTLRWTVSNGTCPASTDDVIINVGEFFIPNGFSPNGDGINDFFMIPGFGFWENIEIQILNRWGNVVYENTNYQNNWDGKNSSNQDLADDTYFYIVKIKNYETLKGFVVIKRN